MATEYIRDLFYAICLCHMYHIHQMFHVIVRLFVLLGQLFINISSTSNGHPILGQHTERIAQTNNQKLTKHVLV